MVASWPLQAGAVADQPAISSRSGEGSSQARDGAGQAAHLHDPAGGVVVLGEHARVLVHIAEQPLLCVRQHDLVLHHCSFEERDDRLAQRGHVRG